MYSIGDVVIYGTEGLCTVQDITEKKFGKDTMAYYILGPNSKKGETVYAPMNNEKILSRMRPVLSVEEASSMIKGAHEMPTNWINDERLRQKTYKETLLYGNTMELLLMTRSLYQHQIDQIGRGKKLHASDERFLKDAERMLFEELSFVLGISTKEVMPMIFDMDKSS